MKTHFARVIALMTLIPFGSLSAQTDQPALIGSRVRITMPPATGPSESVAVGRPEIITGQLIAVTDSTVSLRHDTHFGHVTVPLSRVERVEVSTGTSRAASARRGGLIGVVAGGLIGFAVGEDCRAEQFLCYSRPATAFGGAALGGALGSAIGFAIGGVERWRKIELPARAAVIPTGTGSVMLTATFTF